MILSEEKRFYLVIYISYIIMIDLMKKMTKLNR